MFAQTLATKLYIPPSRAKVVLRPRLIERLNMGLTSGQKPGVTIISTPAGFGKTTLVSEWIAVCGRKTAWLSLDEGDNDLTRFLTYLVAALQTIAPNIGVGMLGALNSPQVPPIESLLTSLINEMDAIPDNFIFVLDDYHMLDSKLVDQALNFLVEHLPQHMHLVIATREDPPLPLARLRVRNQLTELRAADLRFTPAEAADFLNHVMGLSLSAEDIAALEARTEGWIAGLQLAALSMQGHASRDTAGFIQSFTGTHHFVLDYLLEEVLHQQPEKVQAFLLRTSILNRLSGSLCDAVLLDPSVSGQETLESLERANLFIVALDNERHWYRYHHLFGDLLRQRQGQNIALDDIAKLHLQASTWYEQNGDMAEAFQHAMLAKDQNRASDIAERAWLDMDESFQTKTWLGWVNQLSASVRRLRPVLCVQIAWAYMDAGMPDESESFLQEAELCLRGLANEMVVIEKSQFETLYARMAIARAYNSQAKGESAMAMKYAKEAARFAPAENQFMQAQAAVMLAGVHWANGDLSAAYDAMSHWGEQTRKAGNFVFAIMTASGLADILIAQGRLHEAMKTYQETLVFATEMGNESERFTAHHHLGLAMLLHEMGEDIPAVEHLQNSLKLGEFNTIVDWAYRRNLAQARLKESAGDYDAALYLYDEAQRRYVKTPIPNTYPVEAFKARVYIKQGQLAKAREWAKQFSFDEPLNYLHEFEHIVFARVMLAEFQNHKIKELYQVFDILERLLKMAEAGNRIGSMIEILILQSLAFNAQGNIEKALIPLQRAVALAEPEGFVRIFDEGVELTKLLTKLRDLPGNTEGKNYLQKILSLVETNTNLQGLIDPLSERELEVLNLVAQGFSNTKIGEKLFLSLSTIKGHNLRIFNKLQVKSRTEAVAKARELGLIT